MSYETTILIEDIVQPDSSINYSAPQKGAGYHFQNGLHTFTYELEEFIGTIILQGTLEQYPGDDDWVDIIESNFVGDFSTDIVTENFVGNFMWIRVKYQADEGIIHRIRYNY